MTVVEDAIEAELTVLSRLVAAPTGDLGYGVDLSCTTDVVETLDGLAEVDPFSTRAIGEATIRRWTTDRLSLPDDPDYGINVLKYANRGTTQNELRDLSGELRNEALKDDRIDSITVSVTYTSATRTLFISATITPVDITTGEGSPEGKFTLTLSVTDGVVLAELVGVSAES